MDMNRPLHIRWLSCLAGFAGYTLVRTELADALEAEARIEEEHVDFLADQSPLEAGIVIGRSAEKRGLAELIRACGRIRRTASA